MEVELTADTVAMSALAAIVILVVVLSALWIAARLFGNAEQSGADYREADLALLARHGTRSARQNDDRPILSATWPRCSGSVFFGWPVRLSVRPGLIECRSMWADVPSVVEHRIRRS